MIYKEIIPPREFKFSDSSSVVIKHSADVKLDTDEQVTFVDDNLKEYDVVKKDWGYYATPSVNSRLKKFGFKTALTRNPSKNYYIMLVEDTKIEKFKNYLREENMLLVEWLDER